MHETPWRDRGDGRATGQPQGHGVGRFKTRGPRRPAAQTGWRPGVGMVCGAKRIRSLYLPWMTGVTPKLSTTAPPKALAPLSTINAATMRLCRADLPAPDHRGWPVPGLSRGSRSHGVLPHRAYSSERKTAISAAAAGRSCIMRASAHPIDERFTPPSRKL